MAIAIGLISSLFNVTLSVDKPFLPTTVAPMLLSWFYQSLTFLSPLPPNYIREWKFVVPIMASMWDLRKCSASGGTYVIFGLECYPKCSNSLSQRLSNIYNIKLQNDYQLTIKLAINIQLSDTDQSKLPWLAYTWPLF